MVGGVEGEEGRGEERELRVGGEGEKRKGQARVE